ncbi:hypothetical protein C5F48_11705 [Cereibacter changlensis JA139]|uniref:Uncharacterized protein n=1 Tax=Cereibacter changlensis JA139 TaxID=1188249 RepID=A0A2T4JUD6_9RHOB|nr:hypothetical protein C5F48_11705 [Cereibacter changlensis JA139]
MGARPGDFRRKILRAFDGEQPTGGDPALDPEEAEGEVREELGARMRRMSGKGMVRNECAPYGGCLSRPAASAAGVRR